MIHDKHTFSSLYWHYGPFGPQDKHIHSCWSTVCETVLIGTGRECQGKDVGIHTQTTLQAELDRYDRGED